MQFDREKLKQVILYACSRCEPVKLGAVKLHKVLYFSDMLFFADTGNSITGSTYRKRPFGPTCDQLLQALEDLSHDGHLSVHDELYFGYRKKQFKVLNSPSFYRISQEERGMINEVIDFVCVQNSAKTISEFSHNKAWDAAEFGEEIPYSSVLQIFPTQVSLEALNWGVGEANKIEAERSHSDPLDYVNLADFRGRLSKAWK